MKCEVKRNGDMGMGGTVKWQSELLFVQKILVLIQVVASPGMGLL